MTGKQRLLPLPLYITSNRCLLSHYPSFLRVLIEQRGRLLCRDAVVTNLTISWPPEMSPVLTTEGELRQTATHTTSQQCVEANGAEAGSSNDGKRLSDGVIRWNANILPYCSAMWVLKIRRNWYKSLRRTQEAD